jgi:hypothetical protein
MPVAAVDRPNPAASLTDLRDQSTFPEVLIALHTQRYTGPVTLHLIHGVPTVVELPRPVQIRLAVPSKT